MAVDVSGQDMVSKEGFVVIEIKNSHPLTCFAAALPWLTIARLVVKDLKKTTKRRARDYFFLPKNQDFEV